MRSGLLVVSSAVLLLLASCSRQEPVPFSCSPDQPEARDKITIRYDPEASRAPLIRSGAVLFRYTLIGPDGDLYTDALPMERHRGGWRVRLRPGDSLRPSPVVMLCSFVDSEDPELCDSNRGDPWILQFYEGGRLARGAEYQRYRLCSGGIRLPRNLGVPTGGGKGKEGLDSEIAAHPDYLPARAARWLLDVREARDSSGVPDSLRVAIRGELDAIFDMNLRGGSPDTMVAPLLETYEAIGEAARAESLLTEIRFRFPASRFAAQCEYHWACAPDDVEPALGRLEEFLKTYPSCPEAEKARNFLFTIYDNVMSNTEKAGDVVQGGEPIDRWLLGRYSEILIDAENLEGAEGVVRRCLREAEGESWTGSGLSTRMEWQRENDEECMGYRVLLAWILGEKGRYQEAAALLEPIVETLARAGDRVGLANLAECQDSLGRQTEALLTYDRLGEAVPPTDEILRSWGTLYAELHGDTGGFRDHVAKLDEKRRANYFERLERHALDWPAPDVTLTDLSGAPHTLADFRGRVVLLDFWATWCGPCVASLPNVEQLYRSLGGSKEIVLIALNTWERGTLEERRTAIEEKWSELDLSMPVYLDMQTSENGEWGAAELFRVPAIPSSFVIDRQGRILFRGGGLFDEGDVEDLRLKLDFALSREGRTAS